MTLRLFIPPLDTIDAATPLAWMQLDARGAAVRGERTPLAQVPRDARVEAVLPAERVLFARLRLPRVSAATVRELLPYAVEDRLLADPSQVHAVAGATNARGETVVAVVDRAWFQSLLASLARAGLRPQRAWPVSALAGGTPGEWHLAWSDTRGLLVDDAGVSATLDPSPALPLGLRLALDEASARGERPERIRVHAENGARLPDLAAWSADAGAEFERGEAWEALASRAPAASAIDLLQGDFARRGTGAGWGVPRAAVALALILALVHLALLAADTWRLGREREALIARREAIFREAFPEAKVVVDPELQMARNLAELRRTRGLAGGDDFLVQLSRAAREAGGPVRAVEYSGGRLVTR